MTMEHSAPTPILADVGRPRVDPRRARRVADAFIAAPRQPAGGIVHAAYAALATQSSRVFAWLTGDGCPAPVRVAYTHLDEPYSGAAELSESVRVHRLLEVS